MGASKVHLPAARYVLSENLALGIFRLKFEIEVTIMRTSYSESASEVTFENSACLKMVVLFSHQGLV